MHLDYALEGYWLSKRRNLSPNTQRDYELTFRRFLEFMGSDTEVEEITSDDVECFLNFLTDELGLSDKTVINHFIALSSFWTWAERNLEVPHIIRGRVECPRYHRPQIVPFTPEEVRALLEHVSTKRPGIINGPKALEAADQLRCGIELSSSCWSIRASGSVS